jgi:hypothetical protein
MASRLRSLALEDAGLPASVGVLVRALKGLDRVAALLRLGQEDRGCDEHRLCLSELLREEHLDLQQT